MNFPIQSRVIIIEGQYKTSNITFVIQWYVHYIIMALTPQKTNPAQFLERSTSYGVEITVSQWRIPGLISTLAHCENFYT